MPAVKGYIGAGAVIKLYPVVAVFSGGNGGNLVYPYAAGGQTAGLLKGGEAAGVFLSRGGLVVIKSFGVCLGAVCSFGYIAGKAFQLGAHKHAFGIRNGKHGVL